MPVVITWKCDGPTCEKQTRTLFDPLWLKVEISGAFMDHNKPSTYILCSFECLRAMINQWIKS